MQERKGNKNRADMAQEPEHVVGIVLYSASGERLNQKVTFEEYADTGAELVEKHSTIAKAVLGSMLGWSDERVAEFLAANV